LRRLAVKSRLSVIVLVVAAATALVSFAAGSARRPTATAPLIREALVSVSVSTLDPAVGAGTYVGNLGLETLMKLGPTGAVEPNLAQSVTRPNPTTYVYHLRHGVKFWDGTAMTATDVAN